MFEIEFYEDKNGKSEVIDYLLQLQKTQSKEERIKANKIRLYMSLLSELGLELKEPYVKKIDKEIWELRPLKDRFLFSCGMKNSFIILTHFTKQTSKTPARELRKAQKILKRYQQEMMNHE